MKALLIIDMLNDFAHKDGKLYCETAKLVIPKIVAIRKKARELGIPIIYIMDRHKKGDKELKLWGDHAMVGTWGSFPVKDLMIRPSEIVVTKSFYSGFSRSDLDKILKARKIKTLIVTGMHTHICVAHTCYDAFLKGFKLIVVSDATGTFNDKKHKEGLEFIRTAYGAKIIKSGEFE